MHPNMRLGVLVPYTHHVRVLCLFLNWTMHFHFYVIEFSSVRHNVPSSQPPQYVPPSSKSKRPPFICGLDVEFAAEFGGAAAVVVDADPGEFGAIAEIFVMIMIWIVFFFQEFFQYIVYLEVHCVAKIWNLQRFVVVAVAFSSATKITNNFCFVFI